MSRIKLFVPSILGVLIMISSYYFEFKLESNFESDKKLASSISLVLKQQDIEEDAEILINNSVNALLEDNHELLLKSLDFIWALGLGLLVWFFPSVLNSKTSIRKT